MNDIYVDVATVCSLYRTTVNKEKSFCFIFYGEPITYGNPTLKDRKNKQSNGCH